MKKTVFFAFLVGILVGYLGLSAVVDRATRVIVQEKPAYESGFNTGVEEGLERGFKVGFYKGLFVQCLITERSLFGASEEFSIEDCRKYIITVSMRDWHLYTYYGWNENTIIER